MAAMVNKAKSSVVSIQSFVYERDLRVQRVGSGFIYDEMGFVVTLGSVIQGSDSILVTTEDGLIFPSDIVHFDKNIKKIVCIELKLFGDKRLYKNDIKKQLKLMKIAFLKNLK